MRFVAAALTTLLLIPIAPVIVRAQAQQPATTISVPRLINVTGIFQPVDGQRPAPVEEVTLGIYAEQTGGGPLWQETQSIAVDASGRYTLLLGSTQPDGVPLDVFASGEARWLGMVWTRPGEVEGPRMRLTSVPYALSASNAETLGGKPASAYMLSPSSSGERKTSAGSESTGADAATPSVVNPGTTDYLAKYVNATDIGNSAVYEASGSVGIGTTNPLDSLHVRFTNTNGAFTGYAVQNLGSTASSYSGMLFYDQNGALGQFQGFNNSTHEYRINNIASNGSINFMLGGISRFFIAPSGNIGIGTASPATQLDVGSDATGFAGVYATSFSTAAAIGPSFAGRRARGTSNAPTASLSGDTLASFSGVGYGATGFSSPRAEVKVVAAQNWTNAAQGTHLRFATTPNASTILTERMVITENGRVGIGTAQPSVTLDVVGDQGFTSGYFTNYIQGSCLPCSPLIDGRRANGTPASPIGVANGETLASFGGQGYDPIGQQFVRGGSIDIQAAHNWADSQAGANIRFNTTPIGSLVELERMRITSTGWVGIGTQDPLNSLHVAGDIRIGTGTTGCVYDADGTVLTGVCSSDARFKKDITPFGSVLRSLTALQPVHYYWRATEFPDRHFGESRASGLIAQEVEQVLPELVVTDEQGYKAVNYSKLPLLTVQAIKELKAENDAVKIENDALKSRVDELERLINALLTTHARR